MSITEDQRCSIEGPIKADMVDWKSAPSWMAPYVEAKTPTTNHRNCFCPLTKVSDVSQLRHQFTRIDKRKAEGPYPQNTGPDRLIPGDSKLVYMGCFEPYTFVPRKRHVQPNIKDNAVLDCDYMGNKSNMVAPSSTRTRDASSITGREYSRRRHVQGPGDHLFVEDFDGGVRGPAPPPSKFYQRF